MEIHIELEDLEAERPVMESLEPVLDDIDGIRGYDYVSSDRADLAVEIDLEPGAAGTALVGVETFQERLSRRLGEWADSEPDVSDVSVV